MFVRSFGRVATAAALCLAVSAATLPAKAGSPTITQSATDTRATPSYPARGAAAAQWQAGELTNGRIHNNQFDITDWGLTVDTALMLAAEGSKPGKLARVAEVLEANYEKYVSFDGDTFANQVAKMLVTAKVLRANARDFGNRNLRARLLGLVAGPSAGLEEGRVRDTGASDISNTFGQAYAVIGLARSGGVDQKVVSYLFRQRCSEGYFRLEEEVGTTCNQDASPADVDSTALGLQAMLAAREAGATVKAWRIIRTVDWLLSVQSDNGSFGGGVLTEGANTNSTGLAAQALQAVGRTQARRDAANYVARQQITAAKAGDGPARFDIGAIAYNAADKRTALRDGITVAAEDKFRRATPQALFALVPKPLTTLRAP